MTNTPANANPRVLLSTSKGDITVELDPKSAPISTANFLAYVDAKHYDGTIFHRVIDGFMIQGGGFTPDMKQKPTKAGIKNEWRNGLKNKLGTISLARQRGFAHALVHRRVGVHGADEFFGGGFEAAGEGEFGDEFGGLVAHDVRAQDLAAGQAADDLGEAVGVAAAIALPSALKGKVPTA
jgi:peptidyl-prolyl cis-trans isomerase A (cyclophilin A)